MLRRLITIMGVLTGAIAGVGVTFLIGFIAEAITQPDYPDLMLGFYLITLVVCVPLFGVVSGVLFHRLGGRFPRTAPYMLAFQVVALVTVAIFVGPTLFGFKGGPIGIAVDGADNLYVLYASRTDARVEKYDANGALLSQWDLVDSDDGSFSRWSLGGIAVDEVGNVYVLYHGPAVQVEKYSNNGEFLLQWDLEQFFMGTIISYSGITIDESGNVYIIESRQVRKFNSGGDLLGTWGSDRFNSASGIAVDRSGNVFVAETWDHRVQKFSASGQFLTRLDF